MNKQTERDKFWECFDKYLKQNGNPFYVTHTKGGKNQAAGNINKPSPMAMQTICCEYKHQERVVLVQVYINHKIDLFEALYSQKDIIETQLGYSVEWVTRGKQSESVRRIQKVFPINKTREKMVEDVFPYILDFIRVFGAYV